MTKYKGLSEHLEGISLDRWEATFDEIENILGFRLPASAYKYPAWWANQSGIGHSQTTGWRSVGWRTEDLDLPRNRVTFVYEGASVRPYQGAAINPQAPKAITIAEAKAGLAANFNVSPAMIEITIKG
jgi:hypothetical protein